jgi:Family of unknown function (DUF6308)
VTAAVTSSPWLIVGQGEVKYSQFEAEDVIAGFAFGTTSLTWQPRVPRSAGRSLAAAPRATERFMWSYRTYDCVPNSPYAFSMADLLAVAALDAGAGAEQYLAMEALLPDLNEILSHIDLAQTFWTLPQEHLGTKLPPEGEPSSWLWRAWALLMGLDGVGVAITYKTLHRKRPGFFPIFDNQTVHKMGGTLAWQVLHDELTRQSAQFGHLEQWFAVEATKRGGVHLTRLRIHDILLWAGITRSGAERDALTRAGRGVLGRAASSPAAGIEHFEDDDQGFFAWLEANPVGYVVNAERKPKPNYLVLHRPSCPHFKSSSQLNWTKDYVKFCSSNRTDLEEWAATFGGEVTRCQSCFGR